MEGLEGIAPTTQVAALQQAEEDQPTAHIRCTKCGQAGHKDARSGQCSMNKRNVAQQEALENGETLATLDATMHTDSNQCFNATKGPPFHQYVHIINMFIQMMHTYSNRCFNVGEDSSYQNTTDGEMMIERIKNPQQQLIKWACILS